jgi:hypothetical protein
MNTKRILQVHAVDHCNNYCFDCNHYSCLCKTETEYKAEDYFDCLDIIYEKCWYPEYLVIIGGEPFLHSDLTGFCEAMFLRYPKAKLSITTNGFWITKENIFRHKKLFSMLSRFIVTIYPNLFHRINKNISIDAIYAYVKEINPNIICIIRNIKASNRFMHANYAPALPEGSMPLCGEYACNAILPDGRLTRCSTCAYGGQYNKSLSFLFSCSDAYFNVREWPEDLLPWLAKIPFSACQACPFAQPIWGFWRPGTPPPHRTLWENSALSRMAELPLLS